MKKNWKALIFPFLLKKWVMGSWGGGTQKGSLRGEGSRNKDVELELVKQVGGRRRKGVVIEIWNLGLWVQNQSETSFF